MRRVLAQKFALGLFDDPYVDAAAAPLSFDQPADRALARRAAAESLVLLTNDGTLPHNFVVRGTALATPMLKAGEKTTLSLGDLPAGTYEVICDVPGHDAAGMRATLHVAASVGVAGNAQAPSRQASTANATVDFSATPGPAWRKSSNTASGPSPRALQFPSSRSSPPEWQWAAGRDLDPL